MGALVEKKKKIHDLAMGHIPLSPFLKAASLKDNDNFEIFLRQIEAPYRATEVGTVFIQLAGITSPKKMLI